MGKTCCCTGHRPKGFPFAYGKDAVRHKAYLDMLCEKVELAVTKYNVTHFISGMAIGVDLDFADAVLKLKGKYSVTLECAVPCPNQTVRWNERDVARYQTILQQADKVSLISDKYTHDCMLKRNRYMVDNSELVIAVFNGERTGGTWYTINYADKKEKHIEIIDLNEI